MYYYMECYYCNDTKHATNGCNVFVKPDINEQELYQDILKNPEFDPEKHIEDKLTQMMYNEHLWNAMSVDDRRNLLIKCAEKKLDELNIKDIVLIRNIIKYYIGQDINKVKFDAFNNMKVKVIPYFSQVNQTYVKGTINVYLFRDNITIIHVNVML